MGSKHLNWVQRQLDPGPISEHDPLTPSDTRPDPERDWPPASHRDDPDTSLEAEARVTQGGARSTNARIVIQAIEIWPDRTFRELAELMRGEWQQCEMPGPTEVNRRISDLYAKGLIYPTGSRPHFNDPRYSRARTWRVVAR